LNQLMEKLIFTGVLACLCAGEAQTPINSHQAGFPPVQEFHPDQNMRKYLRDKLGSVEAFSARDHIYVREESESGKVETELPPEVAQVNQLFRDVQARLVVSAMVNGSGSEVLIIDSSGKIADKFLCYLPSVSPDGHYVAFIKFYPSHFAEGATDKYLLYNLAKTASANRNPNTPLSEWVTVGKPIFPPGTTNVPGDNTNRQESDAYASASELFWSPDSKRVVFLERDSVGYGLVQASVQPDGGVTPSGLPVAASPICNSVAGANADPSACHLLMRSITFAADGSPAAAEIQVVPDHSVTLDLRGSRFTVLPTGLPTQ
jgi:hypothetical protein